MQQKTLVSWLKAIIIIFGILLAALLFAVLPTAGIKMVGTMPEISFLYWPCLIVSWLFGTPIFLMLMEAWKVCNRIASGQPFCADNARSFVSLCQNALIACGVLLAGNIGLIIVSAVTGLAVYPIAVPVFFHAGDFCRPGCCRGMCHPVTLDLQSHRHQRRKPIDDLIIPLRRTILWQFN